jgi:hypothetical protein
MNTEPQDQSAFPVNCLDKGLTKREYFSVKAMQAFATAWNSELSPKYRTEMYNFWMNKYGDYILAKDALCMDAVELADSLIAALNK